MSTGSLIFAKKPRAFAFDIIRIFDLAEAMNILRVYVPGALEIHDLIDATDVPVK